MVEDGDAEEREAEQDEVDGDAGKVQRLDRCSVSDGRSQQREHARGADARYETAMPSPEGVRQPLARPCQEVAVDTSLPGTHAILSGSTVVSPGIRASVREDPPRAGRDRLCTPHLWLGSGVRPMPP